jgi:hypothetical protein
MMPDATIVAAVNPEFLYSNFISGFCNVIAGEQVDIAEVLVRDRGYFGDYEYGSLIHSKGEFAPPYPSLTLLSKRKSTYTASGLPVFRVQNHCAWLLATMMHNFRIL